MARSTSSSSTSARSSSAGRYTKPALRDLIKKQVIASDKGGKPGQWSARKAQIVAQEYKTQGGGYRGARGPTQRSLSKWTNEEWTTSDGKKARRKGGTTRYLPKNAWGWLSESEQRATNSKKRAGSKRGRQFVANTQKAKTAGRTTRNGRSRSASSSGGKSVSRRT